MVPTQLWQSAEKSGGHGAEGAVSTKHHLLQVRSVVMSCAKSITFATNKNKRANTKNERSLWTRFNEQ